MATASLDFFINPKVNTSSMSKINMITSVGRSKFKKLEYTGKRTFSSIIKKAKEAKRNQNNYNHSVSGTTSALRSVMGVVTAYAGLSTIISGVNLASEVDETNNKMEAVFQSMTGNIRATMGDMSKELGIGKVTLGKDFANIGAIFKGLGFEGSALTKNTSNLLKSAYDAASFHNLDFNRSIEAIRGAMLGESEALKGATGIIVQDSNMKEYASTLGIVWDNLNVSSKAQLRLNYILGQLKKQGAVGDLKKTQNSFENVKKAISETTLDIKAGFFKTLKNSLLPNLIQTRDFLNKNKDSIIAFGKEATSTFSSVMNAMTPLIDVFVWSVKTLWDFKEAIAIVGSAVIGYKTYMGALSLATKIYTGAQWLLNAALTANPIGLVVAGVVALTAGLVIAYKKIKPFRDFIDSLWKKLQNSFFGRIIGKMFSGDGATITVNESSIANGGGYAGNGGSSVAGFKTSNQTTKNTNINQNITVNGGLNSNALSNKIKNVVAEHNRQELAAMGAD